MIPASYLFKQVYCSHWGDAENRHPVPEPSSVVSRNVARTPVILVLDALESLIRRAEGQQAPQRGQAQCCDA